MAVHSRSGIYTELFVASSRHGQPREYIASQYLTLGQGRWRLQALRHFR